MTVKICTRCHETKALNEFHKDRSKRDGHRPRCKTCIAENTRQYYAANKERIDKANRRWRKKNPERDAEYGRRWREANREKNARRERRWRKKNPERDAERKRRWRKKNPEKIVEYDRSRRARKHKADGFHTDAEFRALCKHYDNRCLACGRDSIKLTADHIVPLSQGGSDWISNLQPLCLSCNDKKGTKTIDYRTKPGIKRWIQKKLFG